MAIGLVLRISHLITFDLACHPWPFRHIRKQLKSYLDLESILNLAIADSSQLENLEHRESPVPKG